MAELVKQCQADLERHEGYRTYAYPDPLSYLGSKYKNQPWGRRPAREILTMLGETDSIDRGKPWTVGIGNTVGVGPDTVKTPSQAFSDLAVHIGKNMRELDQLIPEWRKMPFPIQTVLVNLMYNLGLARLGQFKNTLLYLKAGNYPSAAANLERSLWYKQVGKRAQELVARVRTNSIEPKHLVP